MLYRMGKCSIFINYFFLYWLKAIWYILSVKVAPRYARFARFYVRFDDSRGLNTIRRVLYIAFYPRSTGAQENWRDSCAYRTMKTNGYDKLDPGVKMKYYTLKSSPETFSSYTRSNRILQMETNVRTYISTIFNTARVAYEYTRRCWRRRGYLFTADFCFVRRPFQDAYIINYW